MSRVGKMPVTILSGVTIVVADGVVTTSGPKGSLNQPLLKGVDVKTNDQEIVITRLNEQKVSRANHGLMRALISNMVNGVSQGFEKKLELNGVGYRVAPQGADLKFNLGFSHDVIYKVDPEVKVAVDQNIIVVSGIDKQKVGQTAAEIRSLKKPEPYKGKGIKYENEHILRKSGKSGKEAA